MQYQLDEDLPLFGHSSIAGLIKRLNPKKVVVKKGKQGSLDPNSTWAKARAGWVT